MSMRSPQLLHEFYEHVIRVIAIAYNILPTQKHLQRRLLYVLLEQANTFQGSSFKKRTATSNVAHPKPQARKNQHDQPSQLSQHRIRTHSRG